MLDLEAREIVEEEYTECENCGAEDSLRYQEGCVGCASCGYAKCG